MAEKHALLAEFREPAVRRRDEALHAIRVCLNEHLPIAVEANRDVTLANWLASMLDQTR